MPIRSVTDIIRMSDEDARFFLARVRWPDGPTCPKCGEKKHYICRRDRQIQCAGPTCKHRYSITSSTILSSRKLSFSQLLIALAIFTAPQNGTAARRLRDFVPTQYKTAFILYHKIREALRARQLMMTLSGHVEVDGAVFGGYTYRQPSPNHKGGKFRYVSRGRKQIVVVMREKGGRTIPVVCKKESGAVFAVRRHIAQGAVIHVDGAHAWDSMKEFYELMRVEHKTCFVQNGACTNWAESYFARLRAAQRGVYHCIGSDYLDLYAGEIAWRQDTRKLTFEQRLMDLLNCVFSHAQSERLSKYWQQRKKSEWEIAVANGNSPKQRTCLSCSKSFRSAGPQNRLCLRCSHKAAA